MNKYVYMIIKVVTTLVFFGLLMSIVFTKGSKLELYLCAIATVGSYILIFSKKKKTRK